MPKIIQAREVGQLIKDGSTIYIPGFNMVFNEEAIIAMEQSFLKTGHPQDLTCYYTAIGDFKDRGINCLIHEEMLKRLVAAYFKCSGPTVCKRISENWFETYNLPLGVIGSMSRNIASKRPGIITKVGLGTFVDPRVEGGKVNQKARDGEELVEVIQLDNEEWLNYKLPKVDVTLIRGSVADENGNISFYRESLIADWLSAALAAKACGGIVIAQVEQIVKAGTLHSKEVLVPGIVVDYLLVAKPENHRQTALTYFSPIFNGDIKVPIDTIKPIRLDVRKIIGRRAAMELPPNGVVNLGIGIPQAIAAVAAEEKMSHSMHLTTEFGGIGGVPAQGLDFGNAINADATIDGASMFDFYDGGSLDAAFLGSAEIDTMGNVNVSQLGSVPIGCGGFINITQNAKKLIFCGTFTFGGLIVEISNNKLRIVREGKNKKFLANVKQITFSAKYAAKIHQPVLYITERAVFQLSQEGLELIEIAPGIDLEKDILQQMEFKPAIRDIKIMNQEIFKEKWGGLAESMQRFA